MHMSGLARELEIRARENRLEGALQLIDQLEEAYQQTGEALDALKPGEPAEFSGNRTTP
jgi:HPt (histidine-containing phosphotransfer) domain-containing protein